MARRPPAAAPCAPRGPRPLTGEELGSKFERLQHQVDALEERVLGAARSGRMAQELCQQVDERAVARRGHLDSRLQAIEARVKRLERGEDRSTASTTALGWSEEVSRVRNEVNLGLQDLSAQLTERMRELKRWQDGLETEVRQSASDALHTCNRLADDSLAVSEAMQQKLADLREWTEVKQTQLASGLEALRSELASQSYSSTRHPASQDLGRDSASAPPASSMLLPAQGQAIGDPAVLETHQDLAGQIARLGEALKRVVHVQQEQQHRLLTRQLEPPSPADRKSVV